MKKKHLGLLVIASGIILSLLIFIKTSLNKKGAVEDFQEASYYTQLENGKVRCNLCPNFCILKPGQRGICGVRENIKGKLYSLVYGRPVSLHVDPIEKKPLYHFLPGAKAYSLATVGCNMDCKYCQNWDIAHREPEDVESKSMTPEQVVQEALNTQSEVIAFTYSEPTVWYEYMFDIARLAQEKGLRTVSITSGYINPEPLKALLPHLDAVKVDFKAFDDQVYRELIQGRLEPVLETMKIVKQSGKWLEIVNLVVPGYTDDMEEIKQMCQWIKDNLGDEVPVHFSRFWPQYKLVNLPPTPEETIKKARKTCLDLGLKYVYTGNIDDLEGSITYCPDNNQPLLIREGYIIKKNSIDKTGTSSDCPSKIAGVWQ